MYTSQQNKGIIPLLFGNGVFDQNLDSRGSDIRADFNDMVNHLVKLYQKGSISKEALTAVLKHTSCVYIESEITDRIEQAFRNKDLFGKVSIGLP